jgi:hypothetical protein
MIKTGIYGLLRTLTWLGPPLAWWGWLLVGIGLTSGVLGVLFALAQHDLKRLLAYHSVENIGIIASSGTRNFIKNLSGDQKRDLNLIGQFGHDCIVLGCRAIVFYYPDAAVVPTTNRLDPAFFQKERPG